MTTSSFRLRLPTLGAAIEVALATLRRFPLVLASGAAAATAAILMSEDIGPDWLHHRLLAAATLGLPLFTAAKLVSERLRSAAARAGVALVAVAVLAAVHLSWDGWSEPVQFARYVELSLAFHLLVAVLPFLGRDRPNAFWQYNRALFERFVIAGVSSATLFLGLALALAALNKLFGVDLPRSAYFRVWVLCGFVFNTWFFLGGVPDDLEALDRREDYPVVLRVFAQYTLVPLVTVYLVILTLYFVKVVISWDWPSGWIGYLVTGVAGAGILTLLLVHPLAERDDQRWIATFARGFWLGVLPAVLMLWLAVYQRLHQYGFTEPRYFLLVLSVWLAAMAVYYALTHSRKIRVIPGSLCLLALVTFAGPWGAYTVSRRSQLARVRDVLAAHGVLAGGRVRRATVAIAGRDDARVLSGAVRYLVTTHGIAALRPLLGDSFATRVMVPAERSNADPDERARIIVDSLGFTYVSRGEEPAASRTWFSFGADARGGVPVAGYDLLLAIRGGAAPADPRDTSLTAVLVPAARTVRIYRGGRALLDVPLDALLARARAAAVHGRADQLPASVLRAEAENPQLVAVVYLRSIDGQYGTAGPDVRSAGGDVLLKLKPGR